MKHKRDRPLRDKEKVCTDCSLHMTCVHTNAIDYDGSDSPVWLFVGQNPGRTEDREGINFCGKAGNILRDTVYDLVKFPKKDCAFVNATRCWSGPGDPAPSIPQINACKKYLEEDIARLKPKVIVPLGNTALKAVLNKTGISKLQGTLQEKDGIRIVPCYHPSAISYDSTKDEDFVKALKLAKRAGIEDRVVTGVDKVSWEVLTNADDCIDYLNSLREIESIIAFDLETHLTKPHLKEAKLLTVGFSYKSREAKCVPIFKKDSGFSQKEVKRVFSTFKKFWRFRADNELPMSAFQSSFDNGFVSRRYKLPLVKIVMDPYLAHHLIDESLVKPGLGLLSWKYLDIGGYDDELAEYVSQHPECNPDKPGGSYDNIPLDMLGKYNCGDADATLRLGLRFRPILEDQGLEAVLDEVTIPAQNSSIIDINCNGVKVDSKFMEETYPTYELRKREMIDKCRSIPEIRSFEKTHMNKRYKAQIDKWEAVRVEREKKGITRLLKQPDKKSFFQEFNPGSPDHVREVLFNPKYIGLMPTVKTKSGQWSTGREALDELAGEHVIVDLIREYRWLEKFGGTYFMRFTKNKDENDIFFPYIDLTGTVTGRCVSDLHQLPRTLTNADIKKIIISRFGKKGLVMDADFSQAELRIWGMASGDKALHKIYKEGKDAHSMAACWAYGHDYEEFMHYYKLGEEDLKTEKDRKLHKLFKELRTRIKSAVSFGVTFGRHAQALAKDFKWTIEEAQEFIDKYFAVFSSVKRQIGVYRRMGHTLGYTVNLFGRRRRVAEAMMKGESGHEFWARERALRQLVNFPIQSTAHDLLLIAQSRISKYLKEFGMRSMLVGEVHDSIILDVYEPELEAAYTVVRTAMETWDYDWISLPMEAEIKVGPNLAEVRDLHLDIAA